MAEQPVEPLPADYLQTIGASAAPDTPAPAVDPFAGVAAPPRMPVSPNMFDDLIPKDAKPPVQGHAEVAGQALLRGAMEGVKETGQAATPFKDRPAPTPQRDYVGKLLEPGAFAHEFKNPDWYIANFLHGASTMAPSLALGAAGAVGGTAAGEAIFPGGGGLIGGPAGAGAGFGAGSMMQGIASSYQRARAAGLDHDAAVDRAMQEAKVNGAFGFAQGVAPEVKLFGKVGTVVGDKVYQMAKKPISEALAQIFGVQPTLGLAQQSDIAHLEGNQLTPDQEIEGYVQNAGMGLGLVGVHQAISGLRGTNKLPPVAWGNTPNGSPPPGPGPIPPRGQPIDTEFTQENQPNAIFPSRPTAADTGIVPYRSPPSRDDLAAAIQNPPGEPPPGGTAEPATATAPAAPEVSNPAPALPALPTRDDLAAALEGRARATPAQPPALPTPGPRLLLPPPTTFAPPQGPPPGLPALSVKDRIPLMPYTELMNMYAGSNVRDRNLAKAELDRRFPDGSATKVHDVAAQAAQVDTGATDAQKEAGNYQMGHVTISGIPITIEHPAGSIRTGTGPNGPWETHMPVHYGRIKGTEGADGEHVDVFLGDAHNSDTVRVVDQINPDSGKFDEHKALMGFSNLREAKDAYIRSFSDGKGSMRIGAITEMPVEKFKEWLKTGDQSRPLAYEEPKPPAHPAMFDDLIPPTIAPEAPSKVAEAPSSSPEVPANPPPALPEPAHPVAPADPKLYIDNPGGDWLERKQRDAEADMAKYAGKQTAQAGSNFGKGLRGAVTGYYKEFIRLPTSELTKLPGANDEQFHRDDLTSQKRANMENAINEGKGGEIFNKDNPILIGINHKGDAYILEGNHRVAVAAARGIPTVHAEVKYWNGGEAANGHLSPDKISTLAVQASHLPEKVPEPAPASPAAAEPENKQPTAPAPAEPAGPRKGEVGMKLETGEVVTTTTGRQTTPFPKFKTKTGKTMPNHLKGVDRWLMENAAAEAKARGDDFNARMFEANINNPQQADKDSAEHYLFDPDFVFDKQPPAAAPETPPEPKAEEPPAAPEKPAEPKGKKLKDVGEKMEGKRAFQDRMNGKTMPEQAKQIIESTKTKAVFDIEKREGQTEGTARFAQAIVDNIYDFSAYLKKAYILQKSRGRYRSKVAGWEDQVKEIFTEGAENDYHGERVLIKRKDIIDAAEQYIDFGKQLSDMFSGSENIEQFKVKLKDAVENTDYQDPNQFGSLLSKFASQYSLKHDIFSSSEYSRFGGIKDTDAVKKPNRVEKTLTRPKLEHIERVGLKDYRQGRDVTPEEFRKEFGFRGVEFGEWVNAKEGQAHVNHAFDALHDLARRLGIQPSDISLGGKLGFAFGSRGSGEHAAHYEPDTNVINLTKTKGDGSVAHEWLHALDHNLRETGPGTKIMSALTRSLEQKLNPASELEGRIKEFLKGSSYYERHKSAGPIGNAKLFIQYVTNDPYRQFSRTTDFKRDGDALGKGYWGTGKELLARAWEAFVLDTLEGKSPYLVSDWAGNGVVTKESGYRGTPYPTGEERQQFNSAFNDFIKLLEFSDTGVKVKDYAELPVTKEKGKIIDEAEGFIPKLAAMMKEIENGRVQQKGLQSGVPNSDEPASPEDVLGAGEGRDVESPDRGDRGPSGGAVSRTGGEPDSDGEHAGSGESDGHGSRVQRDDTVPTGTGPAKPVQYESVGTNHKIPVGALDEKRGEKQKAKDNLKIIKTVKEIENAGRAATPEEQTLLAKYTGWGSIKKAFPNGEGKKFEGWEDIHDEVKDQLTPDEYKEARRTIQYAHYTSEIVVRGMWKAFERFGLDKGTIFEPGMGVGNFVGMMPDTIKAQYSGLEYDGMTARIAKILYPESSVRHADFTSVSYADGMFDAAIGNPPFQAKGTGYKYDKIPVALHNYFFLKTIDMTAPGGLIGFVTSAGTMDNLNNNARQMMAKNVDLVGAVRLPNTAFKTNAHTEVVTDIIFLRKRLPGEESNGIKWMDTAPVGLTDDEGRDIQVNQYFIDHPEMVLGNFTTGGTMYRKGALTVEPTENRDLAQQIDEAVARLPEKIITEIQKANTELMDMEPPEKKEGSYYIKNGNLMQVVDEKGRPVAGRLRSDGGLTKGDTEKVIALIPIRDALRKTINAMVARDDSTMREGQKELRVVYDKFVKKYGYISKSEVITRAPTSGQLEVARDELRAEYEAMEMEFDEGDTDLNHLVGAINPETGKKYTSGQISTIRDKARAEAIEKGIPYSEGTFKPEDEPANVTIKYPNLDAMKMDQESYNLLVLEKLDEKTGETHTTDFFTKNVVGEMKKPEIKTAVDALHYSLVTKNDVDIPFMAQELGKNPESVIQELEELDLIFSVPSLGDTGKTQVYKEEYLSGHVKDKLAYAKKLAAKDSSYQRNVTALEAVQPADIPVSLINTQLGAKYLEPKVIEDFMGEALNVHATVKYVGLINAWQVQAYDEYAPENTTVYGTEKRYAHEIMESLLMRKPIQVTIKDPDGKTHVDIDATKAAQEKAVVLQQMFDDWIWKSAHGEKVFRKYQDEYNNIAPRVFDGKHLTTAISPAIDLYGHQKDAVWRIIQSGNTYLAHAVGSGKTLEMTVATMEMRRLGQWKKPLQIVPNHMLGQFTKEYREAYPQAKLLIADEHHFDADRRARFVRTVAAGDYDCVIMTEASFSKVPISKEFEAQTIENELFKYRQALEANSQGRKQKAGRGTPAARLEKQIQKMEERLKGLKAKNQDQAFTFEQLGVDAILVDEAHSFRKLSFQTMQGNVNGINPVGSKKAWDMYIKTRFLDTVHPGRSTVFASGTPLTNTMAEVFTIQRFLYEQDLKDRGLDTFDAWSSTFTSTVTRPERQVSGKYKNVTRLALFKNIGVLSPMIRQFMDVVTSEELGNKVDRPVLKSGQMMLETVPPTRQYEAYQKYLAVRTEEIAKNPNRGEPGQDIILSVITDGRLAAIDMRLIDPTLPEQNSKLEHMISQTYEEWKRESNTEYRVDYKKDSGISPIKGSTQLIFSDLGVNGRFKNGRTFSAYDQIKKQLIKYGVPASQIAFAGDYDTTEEKRRLYRMVNNGEVRILIGSTSKMGTGMNVQNRLKSIRNLDAPHNPSDLEQRNGRGLRQGNQNKEIGIYAYSTDGSYDSQTWDTLQRKARYIRQFMKGESNEDMADITDDVNMFDLARAMTAGDARLIKEVELRGKVDDLQRGANNFNNEQMKVKGDISRHKNGVEFRENEIKQLDEALKIRKEPAKGEFLMTVMGKPYIVRADASKALGEAVDAHTKDQTSTEGSGVKIGEYQGFDVKIFIGKEAYAFKSNVEENKIIMACEVFLDHPALAKEGKEWKVDLTRQADAPPFSGSGTITVLTNSLDNMEDRKIRSAEMIKGSGRAIKVLESQIADKYPKAAELLEKREELNAIQKDLQDNAPVDVIYEDYPVDYWKANKEDTAKVSDSPAKGTINDVLRKQELRKASGK